MAKSRRAKPKSHFNPDPVEPKPLSIQEKGAMDYFATCTLPTGRILVAPGTTIIDAKGFVAWNLATVERAPGTWLARLAIDHLRQLKTYIENNK